MAFTAIVGAAVVGGGLAYAGSTSAAQTQAGAANQASALQYAMFQQEQAQLQPWQKSGRNALAAQNLFMGLGGKPGQFNPNAPGVAPFSPSMLPGDPSYQWRLQQGQNAILNNMANTGGAYSGNTLRGLQDYTQGLASTQYQTALGNYTNWQSDVFNRLNAMSGTGANAAGGIAGLGMGTGQLIGGNIIGAGNALAAGQVGGVNAISGALGSGVNNYMLYNLMQQMQGGGGMSPAAMGAFESNYGYNPTTGLSTYY